MKFRVFVTLGVIGSALLLTTFGVCLERKNVVPASFEDVAEELEDIYILMQKKEHKLFNRIPNVSDLRDGELVLSKVGSTVKIYCRVMQSTYSVTMSN